MTNHIHFLVTPEDADSISRATSVIGSRYAWYFNRSYKRTGTVWEGRHKSSLVQTDRYFLTCCRYIEMNPVVAGMVHKPEEYLSLPKTLSRPRGNATSASSAVERPCGAAVPWAVEADLELLSTPVKT
jgi:putative transposase